jgi:hypothetical protein
VPHVLAPGLEFLWGAPEPLAEAGQGRTEAVWICVGNVSSLEGFPEYRPYWPSIAPVRPGLRPTPRIDAFRREQRV